MNIIEKRTLISKIPFGYYQIFDKPFTLSVNEIQVVKMKNEGIITKSDVDISRFVFENKFITEQQLILLAREFGDGLTKTQLLRLLEARILNRFNLSINPDDEFQEGGLIVYCLDLGGKYLLEHYSNEDVVNWTTTDNMMDSGLVSKQLMNSDFQYRLVKSLKEKIVYHRSNPSLRISREEFLPSSEFQMEELGRKQNFIVQAVKIEDFPTQIRTMVNRYSYLLESNAWKKYYYETEEEPLLFFLADSLETALIIGRMMENNTEITRYRITVTGMLSDAFTKGILLRYDAENDKIVKVRNRLFIK